MWRGQSFSPSIEIGNNAVINPLSHVGCINRVVIGNYVSIGERTYITDHVHGASGHNSMIGANAVVTKSVPPFSIVGGNPAKVLKIISNE